MRKSTMSGENSFNWITSLSGNSGHSHLCFGDFFEDFLFAQNCSLESRYRFNSVYRARLRVEGAEPQPPGPGCEIRACVVQK